VWCRKGVALVESSGRGSPAVRLACLIDVESGITGTFQISCPLRAARPFDAASDEDVDTVRPQLVQ